MNGEDMPYVLSIIHVALVIGCIWHIVTTQQERYWIFIILLFPGIGIAIYFLLVFLPSLRNTRQAYRLERNLRQKIAPDRALRDAQNAFEFSATMQNRVILADALFEKQKYQEAIQHYQEALVGIHAEDDDLLKKLIRALLENGQFHEAYQRLPDLLKQPLVKDQPEVILLQARVYGANNDPSTREIFDLAVRAYSGYEARVRFAEYLIQQNDFKAANMLLKDLLLLAKQSSTHVRELNKEWLQKAKNLQRHLDEQGK